METGITTDMRGEVMAGFLGVGSGDNRAGRARPDGAGRECGDGCAQQVPGERFPNAAQQIAA